MEIVRLVLLSVHLLSFAVLLGALVAQIGQAERAITPVIRWGARIVFLAGLGLVGVLEADDDITVNHAKVGIKLLIALVVLALVEANGRKPRLSDALYYAIVGLTAANVVVALFVSPTHRSY